MHEKLRLFSALLVLFVASAAVGCRNGAKRDDPFLQRRLIPPPPQGNYAPPAGSNYGPPGAPVLQPIPGPQLGQAQPSSPAAGGDAIRPASALGGSNDGWIRARDASTVPLDHAAAVEAEARPATASAALEPRRLVVLGEDAMRPVPAERENVGGLQTNTFRGDAEPANPSKSDQNDVTPSPSSLTSLDWTAPRRP